MTKLLIKLFVKDYKNTDDVRVRESYGKFSGVVGIVSNLVLCAAKILIGIISASIAIIADGINKAREVIANGAARAKLAEFIECTQRLAA